MERDDPSRSRGFGFVGFANPADAQRACDEMHDQEIDGRRIKVDLQTEGGKGGKGGKGESLYGWCTRSARRSAG